MIFVKLRGGLGNQMFQYACALRLALRHGTQVALDLSFLLDRTPRPGLVFRDYDLGLFTLEAHFVTPAQRRFHWIDHRWRGLRPVERLLQRLDPLYHRERSLDFDPRIATAPDGTYLDGYWQSEKYFADVVPAVREAFTFRAPLPEASLPLLDQIRAGPSVCLNVRRGDFVASPMHGTVTTDYLERGAALVAARCASAPTVFVFSDDLDWCRAQVKLPYPTVFVGHEHKGDRFGAYLQLMISCDHFVIPNSSFGWWAAWLGRSPHKVVVATRRWYASMPANPPDLLPPGWLLA